MMQPIRSDGVVRFSGGGPEAPARFDRARRPGRAV